MHITPKKNLLQEYFLNLTPPTSRRSSPISRKSSPKILSSEETEKLRGLDKLFESPKSKVNRRSGGRSKKRRGGQRSRRTRKH